MKIFITHLAQDKSLATDLYTLCKRNGHEIWQPERTVSGRSIKLDDKAAARWAIVTVGLLSPSIFSEHGDLVRNLWNWVIQQKLTFFLVKLEPLTFQFHIYMSLQQIECYTTDDNSTRFHPVIERLKNNEDNINNLMYCYKLTPHR